MLIKRRRPSPVGELVKEANLTLLQLNEAIARLNVAAERLTESADASELASTRLEEVVRDRLDNQDEPDELSN